MNINSFLVLLRDFYQSYINTSIISIILDGVDNPKTRVEHRVSTRERKVSKPFILVPLNFSPYFVNKFILGYFKIDYLYKIDNIVRLSSTNLVSLRPIIISFNIVDSNKNFNFNLSNILKKYDNNVPLNFIIENEVLENSESKYESFFMGIKLFEITYNQSLVSTCNNENEELNKLKILNSDEHIDPFINYTILKNGSSISREINFKKNKYESIYKILNLDNINNNE